MLIVIVFADRQLDYFTCKPKPPEKKEKTEERAEDDDEEDEKEDESVKSWSVVRVVLDSRGDLLREETVADDVREVFGLKTQNGCNSLIVAVAAGYFIVDIDEVHSLNFSQTFTFAYFCFVHRRRRT